MLKQSGSNGKSKQVQGVREEVWQPKRKNRKASIILITSFEYSHSMCVTDQKRKNKF